MLGCERLGTGGVRQPEWRAGKSGPRACGEARTPNSDVEAGFSQSAGAQTPGTHDCGHAPQFGGNYRSCPVGGICGFKRRWQVTDEPVSFPGLCAAAEIQLAPGLENDDRHCVREVETAVVRQHRQA